MKRVRVALVAALFVVGWINGALHAAPAALASTCGGVSCFGPGDAAWDAYYANPADTSKWSAFCAGGGGSVAAQAIGVPACGPTGSTNISLKGNVYTPGFQCVELTDRYLYVTKGWTAVNANGAGVARGYAAAHSLSTVSNGTVGKAPRVGDVISFSSVSDFSDTGHAAVVYASSVDGSGNGSVSILNQNVSINGATATGATINLSVANWNVAKLGFNYVEWLPLGVSATVPDAPPAPSATAGNASASVSFSAPASDGGSPITSYRVTASPGGATATGTASPVTVTGLTNGTAYTFTVRATNAVGNGPESPASNSVTPAASATPTVSVNDVAVTESNASSTATFTVSLSASSSSTVSVKYATKNKTAKAPEDFAATSGTVTFTPGQTSKTVSVTVAGDTLFETAETFLLNLTNPVGATIADAQGVGTITNDDPMPSVSIGDVSKVEGNSGSSTMTFTVSLSTASGAVTKVKWATTNGSATAGSDYTGASGTVSIPAGVTSATFTVTVTGDTTVEPNETFLVKLSKPTNATIADGQATATITNDD